MTIEVLNALDRSAFVDAVGWVFEKTPWVAERAWPLRPFVNVDALHRAMVQQVEEASTEEKLALLRAHPDLGTRMKLSEASRVEQSGAGLDQLLSGEYEGFASLNEKYTEKFGFPFIFAVKGSGKDDILDSLLIRSESSYEEEFAAALWEVNRIAAFRLRDYLKSD